MVATDAHARGSTKEAMWSAFWTAWRGMTARNEALYLLAAAGRQWYRHGCNSLGRIIGYHNMHVRKFLM